MDPIGHFAEHVATTDFATLPPEAVSATKTFLLDTLGVGVAGSSGPFVAELIASQQAFSAGQAARVFASGTRLSPAGAALCNAYQIHNSEFDCVHEAAVVHTMTVVTAALMAHAEAAGNVSGEALITALALGVDVACNLGVASKAPLRFFRPATAGAFAATAGLGHLRGFDTDTLINAFGTVHSQLSGTMQAHTEGSIVLGLQIGYSARNAVLAVDLAARGLKAPQAVLNGPFGFFPLFEGEADVDAVLPSLGHLWRICEVAHKPFPCGRATHGVIDAALRLQLAHQFGPNDIEAITARVTPLVHHLVGRPLADQMTQNYARLCTAFCLARALIQGGLQVSDFLPSVLTDPPTHELARRVAIQIVDNPDPNALTPAAIDIRLRDGRTLALSVDTVYGNPARPMTREAQIEKLHGNWQAASPSMPMEKAGRLVDAIEHLEASSDVATLVDELVA